MCLAILAVLMWTLAYSPVFAVTISTVPIGNPGNAPDTQNIRCCGPGYGSVGYEYSIGKYEVTNSQYAEFLNSVDPAGLNGLALYSNLMQSNVDGGITRDGNAPQGSRYQIKANRGQSPVVFVSWFDAVRFANWMHNGQ